MEPFVGEIRYVGFNFAPVGWAVCNGAIMAIAEDEALFALIGTIYGGDGVQTFALPDLIGRVSVGQGNTILLGERLGEESHTLTVGELPQHNHSVGATSARANDPGNNPTQGVMADPFGNVPGRKLYGAATDSNGAPGALQPTGTGLPHENRQPYACLLPIIALFGIFPSPN